jgi:acyl-CoA dehydrogenase
MYSFEPTDEQKMLLDAITKFANNDLRPKSHDAEEGNQLPENLVEKGWELGLLQASTPEAYGGFGDHSYLTSVLAAEQMAFGDLAGALAVLTPSLFVVPILLAGTEEQKIKYIPPVIEEEWQPYTAALIEQKFDFDPNDLSTTSSEQPDGYFIKGQKTYVPYADIAQAMIVYAKLEGRTQGFIVPNDTVGVEIGERQKLLGIHALPVFSVGFNEVKIPKENRLGGENGHEFTPILDSARIAMAAMAVGLSKAAYEYARDYAKDRDVFGVKVAQKQVIAFMLAEMATEIEAIRLLTWEAAWMMDNAKEEASKQAYLAHTGAVDMSMMITDRAVQILGGHGYIREHPVELWMRNGRGIPMLTGLAIL